MVLDVDATDRTAFVRPEPLVHAFHVKQMHARKSPTDRHENEIPDWTVDSPDILFELKLAQADGALFDVLLPVIVYALFHLLVLVGESVSFDGTARCSSVLWC